MDRASMPTIVHIWLQTGMIYEVLISIGKDGPQREHADDRVWTLKYSYDRIIFLCESWSSMRTGLSMIEEVSS